MRKIEHILPSLREKKRYIVFEVTAKKPVENHLIRATATKAIHTFLGDLGVAKAGVMFVEGRKQRGILKVNHKFVNEVRTALAGIKEMGNQEVIVKTRGVSGIIKKARESYFNN